MLTKNISIVCCVSLFLQSCVSPVVSRRVRDRLTREELEQVGRTEVVAMDSPPEIEIKSFNARHRSMMHVGLTLAISGAILAPAVDPYTYYEGIRAGTVITGALIGGGVGAIVGYATGEPDEDIVMMEINGTRVIKQLNPKRVLPAAIAKAMGNPTVHILKKSPSDDTLRRTYVALAENGVLSVLEVTVDQVGISGAWIHATVSIRLCNAVDGEDIYEATYCYRTPSEKRRSFKEWGRDHVALKAEFRSAFDAVADAVVQDITGQGKTPKASGNNPVLKVLGVPIYVGWRVVEVMATLYAP